MSVTTLVGSPQRVLDELTKIRTNFIDQYGELAVEVIDDPELPLETILAAAASLPFLVERKLVIIKDLSRFSDAQDLQNLLAATSDSVELVLTDRNLDKRSKLYKTLQKTTEFNELRPASGQNLVRQIIAWSQEIDLRLSPQAAEYLIDQVGENEAMLKSELHKLAIVGKADKSTIDELVEKQVHSRVFDLLDAAMNKQLALADQLYAEQRAQKVEPQAIWALIVWQLQVLALAKTTKDPEAIAKQAGINVYPIKKALKLAKSMDYARMLDLTNQAVELDLSIKNGIDPDSAIRLFLANLAT
ncbi:DNA polymerase III subunit delta [Candidatus Saccharibacteria bacterium]|nr:DNA polymerase III subunit delta [Candidatus Saccharibacteria bacterium]MCB9821194.1 DNA polymerase III subunit delta [Candidatus Nomurabacteria bacterium]